MLFACLAIDGTAKKMYPQIGKVGERLRNWLDFDQHYLGLGETAEERATKYKQ